MGATPRASLLSLGLPPDLPLEEFDDIVTGFLELAAAEAPLVGGNLTRSPGPLILDVTAMGVAHRRKLLLRSTGRPGDEIYVTGTLGGAAAGLAMLADGASERLTHVERACIGRHRRPMPRLRLGRTVARSHAAAACVDLSDGLSDAAQQLAAASETGVVIEQDLIPIHPGVRAWSARGTDDPLELALSGGEDYELLFAVRPRMRSRFLAAVRRFQDVPVTRVGVLTDQAGAWVEQAGTRRPLPAGFAHFGANRP
jgi:thiamine-monophosphate kinase